MSTTILQTIIKQRRIDVEEAKKKVPLDILKGELDGGYSRIDFYERIQKSAPRIAVMAEVKRASPSKGVICISSSNV
jgi:indole-3-glycerol phosphate synthase